MEFYSRLKERVSVKDDEKSKEQFRFHKKYVQKIRTITLFIFLFCLPFFECPNWCYNALDKTTNLEDHLWDFYLECENLGYPFSKFPTLMPTYTSIIDVLCLCIFGWSRWYKRRWAVPNKMDSRINITMVVICSIQMIDLTIGIFFLSRPYVANMMRPIVAGCFLKSVRKNAINMLRDLRDSAVVLATIFMFVFVFACIGHFFFR